MMRLNSRLFKVRLRTSAHPKRCRDWLFSARFALIGATAAISSPLHGFYEIARGELILNTTALATYDSNIYTRSDSVSDLYFSLIPELQFLRHAGRGTIDARTGVNVTRFLDYSDEDFEDFHASLHVSYPVSPDSPLSGTFFIAATEESDVNDLLNTRVKSRTIGVGTDSLYQVSERLALRNALGFEDKSVKNFSGTQTYGGSLGIQWLYSEKLSFFTDYRLRLDESDGDDTIQGRKIDNTNHAILFGAIGTLRPRIEGTAKIGFQRTEARADESDQNLLLLSADLTWLWRPKTTLSLHTIRELDVSPADETVERSEIDIGATHILNEKITLTGHIGYRRLVFNISDRTDDAFLVGTGLEYIFSRYWQAGADLEITFNSSTQSETDYDRQMVHIYTRYSF